jgi:hypothetical protein
MPEGDRFLWAKAPTGSRHFPASKYKQQKKKSAYEIGKP